MIACLWIVCQSTQVSSSSFPSQLMTPLPPLLSLQAVFGPSWNPLDPIYKVLYLLLQVDKPEVDTKPSPPQGVIEKKSLTQDPPQKSLAISPAATEESQRKAKKSQQRAKSTGKKVD
jgi:hypothetical protein